MNKPKNYIFRKRNLEPLYGVESFAEIYIKSIVHSFDDLKNILEVHPSRGYAKGEMLFSDPAEFSCWILSTKNACSSKNPNDHLCYLFSKIEKKQELIRDLSVSPDCHVGIGVAFCSSFSSFGFEIESSIILRFCTFSNELWFFNKVVDKETR